MLTSYLVQSGFMCSYLSNSLLFPNITFQKLTESSIIEKVKNSKNDTSKIEFSSNEDGKVTIIGRCYIKNFCIVCEHYLTYLAFLATVPCQT